MNNYQNNGQPVQYYNNGYNRRPLSSYIIRFLLAFLFAALLIFILLWLFPTKSALNPLYDRIFQDNLNTMKEVSTAYYTTERLPKNEGDTKKMTLGEMLEMKLLTDVKDKNGNTCDVNNSYVEITKLEKEYKLKVNLKCGNEEDYIITYLGCYNYCLNDICERQREKETKSVAAAIGRTIGGNSYIPHYSTYPAIQTPATKYVTYKNVIHRNIVHKVVKIQNVTKKIINKITNITIIVVPDKPEKHYCEVVDGVYYDKNGKKVTQEEFNKSCNPEPEKHYCEIIDGIYYDKDGNIASQEDYNKSCNPEPEKHYCQVIDGVYYDINGNVVTEEEYNASCNPEPEKHYCQVIDGVYYDKEGNIVSEEEYNASCNPEPEKHYCEIIDGIYYDKDGNIASQEDYNKSCNPEPEKYYCEIVDGVYYDKEGNIVSEEDYNKSCNPEPEYRYLYEKEETIHHEKEYSDWSPWSENIEYDPNNNNINWGKHEFDWYEKNGSKTITTTKLVNDTTKPIYKKTQVYIGSYPRWTCGNYEFYIDTTTQTTYKVTTGWTRVGTVTSSSILSDSNNTKYVIDSIDYEVCDNDACSTTPRYTYIKYTRTSSATSDVGTSESEMKAKCTNVIRKDIPVYTYDDDFVAYEKKRVTTTETIYLYHMKTRKLIHDEYTDTKKYTAWSRSDHDATLIEQGYEYTGIKELITA